MAVKSVDTTRVLELTVRDFLFVVEPRENSELQDALAGVSAKLDAACSTLHFAASCKSA